MPELPEVETIRRSLEPLLVGRMVVGAEVHLPKALRGLHPEDLKNEVANRRIISVDRRGKYLLLRFEEHMALVFHLRMTGRLTVKMAEEPLAKQTTLILLLDDGRHFRFEDTRKFGTVDLWREGAPHTMVLLGPEPLGADWTGEDLAKAAGKKRTSVKAALLDQRVVAGLGNIYVDEALHRSGIYPGRLATGLSTAEWQSLHRSIQGVLSEGIRYRGTTRRDYRDATGRSGEYQDRLKVYGRKGLPCLNCGQTIERRRIAGRGTHFCPRCQPPREGDAE